MPATRIDYKRELLELYAPGAEPAIVDVPEPAFLMVDGHGDPNTAVEYREAVEALFAVSYATKFVVKRAPGAVDFAVMPLEGLWWVPDMSKFTMEDKPAWSWTAMIMQPDPVTAEGVEAATHKAASEVSSFDAIKPLGPTAVLTFVCVSFAVGTQSIPVSRLVAAPDQRNHDQTVRSPCLIPRGGCPGRARARARATAGFPASWRPRL
jgi:hypothetical protein